MGRFSLQLSSLSIFLLLSGACQKKEFTQPVATQLAVKMEEGSSSDISFEMGTVFFQQIQFDGHRRQGGDVHFSTEVRRPMGPVNFTGITEGYIKNFDIPQGVYTHMQWQFTLGDMDELDDAIDGELDEPDLEGGIVFYGSYRKADGTMLPMRIIIDEDEQFSVSAVAADGSRDITLTNDNSYSVLLLIDPYYAVRSISSESWENAEIETEDDEAFIEVSSDMNESLYETILFRFESSVKVVIQ